MTLASCHSTHCAGDSSLTGARTRPAGVSPINAKCETVHRLPIFQDAYRLRQCIFPVDGFYEWKAIKGQKAKQPYAIAMKDDKPFGYRRSLGELERPDIGRVD